VHEFAATEVDTNVAMSGAVDEDNVAGLQARSCDVVSARPHLERRANPAQRSSRPAVGEDDEPGAIEGRWAGGTIDVAPANVVARNAGDDGALAGGGDGYRGLGAGWECRAPTEGEQAGYSDQRALYKFSRIIRTVFRQKHISSSNC